MIPLAGMLVLASTGSNGSPHILKVGGELLNSLFDAVCDPRALANVLTTSPRDRLSSHANPFKPPSAASSPHRGSQQAQPLSTSIYMPSLHISLKSHLSAPLTHRRAPAAAGSNLKSRARCRWFGGSRSRYRSGK